MRKWFAILAVTLGLPLVACTGFVAWGTTLPVHHTATATALVGAPPEAVYRMVASPERGPQWRSDVERVEVEGPRRWREYGEEPLTIEVREANPPHRFVTEVVEHPDFGGTWTWGFVAEGAGTEVTLTEDGEVYDPFFRAVMTALWGPSHTIEARLAELAAHYDP